MERPSAGRRSPALRLTLLAALLGGGGCGTEPEPVPTAMRVIGPTQRLAIGATFTVTANVEAGGTTLTTAKVAWASRDSTTAAVDANGTVTAKRAGEAWVVGASGPVKDSALIEVAYAAQAREGRLRVRSGTSDQTVAFSGEYEPLGLRLDYLGRTQEDHWQFFALNPTEDTLLVVLLPEDPNGSKLKLTELTAPQLDALTVTDLVTPVAYLDLFTRTTERLIPLKGYVEVGVEQSIPLSTRVGSTRLRLVGTGNAWQWNGAGYVFSGELFDVVADMRPAYLHLPNGTSAGSLTGTQPNRTWSLRTASWSATTSFGRTSLLRLTGLPTVSVYLPGTVSVDLGTSAETAKGLLTLRDSTVNYNGSASSGRVTVSQYTPPGSDLFGEIRGSVTASGTGTLGAGAAQPFTASFDFDAPVSPSTARATDAGVPAGAPLLERARRLRWPRGDRPR